MIEPKLFQKTRSGPLTREAIKRHDKRDLMQRGRSSRNQKRWLDPHPKELAA